MARAAIRGDRDRARSIAKGKSADLFLPLALRFSSGQLHRDLLDVVVAIVDLHEHRLPRGPAVQLGGLAGELRGHQVVGG